MARPCRAPRDGTATGAGARSGRLVWVGIGMGIDIGSGIGMGPDTRGPVAGARWVFAMAPLRSSNRSLGLGRGVRLVRTWALVSASCSSPGARPRQGPRTRRHRPRRHFRLGRAGQAVRMCGRTGPLDRRARRSCGTSFRPRQGLPRTPLPWLCSHQPMVILIIRFLLSFHLFF